MARKTAVKVYLSEDQISMANRLASLLGEDRSGAIRISFLSYAKDVGILQERLLNPPENSKR